MLSLSNIALLSFYVGIGFMFQFPSVSMRFWLIETCKVSPAQLISLYAVISIPWMFKPIYGFVSDAFPLCGYHRKPYIFFSMTLAAFCWILLAILPPHILSVTALMTIASLAICITDVMVDSMLVMIAREESEEKKGTIQSHAWGARFIGGLVAASTGGVAYDVMGSAGVFVVQSCIPLVMACFGLFLKEHKNDVEESSRPVKETVHILWKAVRQPDIFKPALFIFVIGATPDYGGALTFFYEKKLKFSADQFAFLDVLGYVCAILSTIMYRKFFKHWSFRKVFAVGLIASFLAEQTLFLLVTHYNRVVGIPDITFAAMERVALTFVNEFLLLPMVVMGARICPKHVEGSLYALLMSISNFSGALGGWWGSLITSTMGVTSSSFRNLWMIMIICHFFDLFPICFLPLVPDTKQESQETDEEKVELVKEISPDDV